MINFKLTKILYYFLRKVVDPVIDFWAFRKKNLESVFTTIVDRGDKKINPHNTFGAFYGFDKKSVETISSVQDLGSLINAYY